MNNNFSVFLKESLILIQENMTWIEAMDYCREHHLDLVDITTKDLQGKVAETAKNATSLHVWLGLRYTCKFNFWFWTKSTSGCYHNWASGQGFEVKYDCGVAGAIEATGWQQWVGLPETEQLNFICYTCPGWVWKAKVNQMIMFFCNFCNAINSKMFYFFISAFDYSLNIKCLTMVTSSEWTLMNFNKVWRHTSAFVEIQLPSLLLRLNFIKYENLMWCVGVHIHSHGQQE